MRKNSAACALRRCIQANSRIFMPASPVPRAGAHEVPAEEERAVLVDSQPTARGARERHSDVRRLHEAKARVHDVDAGEHFLGIASRYHVLAWRALDLEVQDHDVLAADAVVLQVFSIAVGT